MSPRFASGAGQTVARRAWGVALLDFLLVTLFVAIGLHSHHQGAHLSEFALVLYPFALGTGLGEFGVRRTNLSPETLAGGVIVALSTVVLGMLLRVFNGQGTDVAFVIVATLFVSFFLLSWRLAVHFWRRRSAKTDTTSP